MKIFNNVLETIGNTPLIKLNKIMADVPATVLAKVETFNPGHSIKDRMAVKMLEVAEEEGKIKPGGTIVECTSGNTGMGLAIAAAVKGYHCIFTTSDKQSKEKIDMLRAMGAEVIVCPTNVSADDPRSYYSVAERISEETPNSFWFNQYDNLANRLAHYETTGPEIWEQTDGKITHFVVGVGTGGTISGTAKYLKEKNPNIKVWGIDAYGSVFKKYHETGEFDEEEIYSYITEGIGEDIIPKNVDFDLIDRFEKVTDKDGAVYARKMAREEGLLMGYSAGSAIAGIIQLKEELSKDDLVVVAFHDHGSRYVAKVYNDLWMRAQGFLDDDIKLDEVIQMKVNDRLITVDPETDIKKALELMLQEGVAQLPVFKDMKNVGTVTQNAIAFDLLEDPNRKENGKIDEIMQSPLTVVSTDTTALEALRLINKNDSNALLVKDRSGQFHIVSQYDILQAV